MVQREQAPASRSRRASSPCRCTDAMAAQLPLSFGRCLKLARASCSDAAVRADEDGTPDRMSLYSVGSSELIDALQGPCQRHGLSCTDLYGDGRAFQFERM